MSIPPSATFPITIIPKFKGLKKIAFQKPHPVLVNGEIGQSFHIDVAKNVQEAQCGGMTDFIRCTEEQKDIQSSDLQTLSSKYNFPVYFLKEAIHLINELKQKEQQQKIASKFRQEIINDYKKRFRYPIDRKLIKVNIDPELTALSQMYLKNE